MKKLILLILWLVFVTGCQPKTTKYIHYHNERFGFELDYPSFMTMDPPPENGDGISCHGKGLELTATGGLDMTWMDLDDTGLTTRDLYPQDEVFYVQHDIDASGTVHYTKTARFPNTDNGDIILTLQLTYPQGQADSATIHHILNNFSFHGIN